jgi:hypothetical protein
MLRKTIHQYFMEPRCERDHWNVALFVKQCLDQLLIVDDDGGIVISFQREKAAVFLWLCSMGTDGACCVKPSTNTSWSLAVNATTGRFKSQAVS